MLLADLNSGLQQITTRQQRIGKHRTIINYNKHFC